VVAVEGGVVEDLLERRSTLRLVPRAAFRQRVVSLDERAAQRLVGAVVRPTALTVAGAGAAAADHVRVGRGREADTTVVAQLRMLRHVRQHVVRELVVVVVVLNNPLYLLQYLYDNARPPYTNCSSLHRSKLRSGVFFIHAVI